MVAKPRGIGENKVIQIGSNRYGDIAPDIKRVEKIKAKYLAGDTVLSKLKAVYNGEGVRLGKHVRRMLDYGTPSKDKNY